MGSKKGYGDVIQKEKGQQKRKTAEFPGSFDLV